MLLHPSVIIIIFTDFKVESHPGEAAGAALPLVASEHAYIVSDIIPNLGIIPNLRCPDDSIYTKASLVFFPPEFTFEFDQVQNDTLYLGAFEANPGFWEPQPGFAFGLFDLNMESYLPYLEAIHRQPRYSCPG